MKILRTHLSRIFCLWLAILFLPATVFAHSNSHTVLHLEIKDDQVASLSLEIDLLDLAQILPLDHNRDAKLQLQELNQSREAIQAYILQKLQFNSGEDACAMRFAEKIAGIKYRENIPLVVLNAIINCTSVHPVSGMHFSLFDEIEQSHRGVLNVSGSGNTGQLIIGQGSHDLKLQKTAASQQFISFGHEGFLHILEGYDHLAFLLVLLLPLLRLGEIRTQWWKVLGIVTAFTVAHSITLSLVALGKISLPSGPVEIVIAASVLLAAMLNIVKPRMNVGWKIAYAFGLIHGFGFAGALAEISANETPGLMSLFGFNLGVELGQLAVVLVMFPLMMLISAKQKLVRYFVPVSSLLVGILASSWILERVMNNI